MSHTLKSLFPHLKKADDTPILSLENDSRCVSPNSLFIAFTGFERDLHQFIPAAYEKGCRMFLIAEGYTPPQQYKNAVFIPAGNLKQENARVARLFYDYPDEKLCLICVTGTNGKTTTSTMIDAVLGAAGKKTAFFGTTHWRIGEELMDAPNTTPDLLPLIKFFSCCLDKGVTHVVMEAASHALALGRMECLAVDAAVFTNLTQDHLDFHKTMDDYYLAKRSLFTGLLAESPKPNKKAFINADDIYGQKLLRILGERGIVSESLSLEGKGSVNASDITYSPRGVRFMLGDAEVFTPMIGRVNVQNAMTAYCVAKHLGVPSNIIIDALKKTSVKGRMERAETPEGTVFLVDFAHTPDALQRAVASAQSAKSEGSRLIVVFGAGGDRDKTKRPLMARAALGADTVIITSDNPRTEDPLLIIEDIKKGIPADHKNVHIQADRRKALALALSLAQPRDVILVAGKGHEEYQILGKEKTHFSDIEEINKIIGGVKQ